VSLQTLAQQTAADFARTFGREPTWIAAAPGRVNIIGEHTDYNDGFVFPMAIERYTVIAAAPNNLPKITLRSALGQGAAAIDLGQPLKPGPKGTWSNYPLGVIAGFIARKLAPAGFDALITSTVPLGGGLSSSASLEVATATLVEAVLGTRIDPVEKALLCQKAEHDYAGMPCGIMDQFVSTLGQKDHVLLLDCRSRRTELVPFTDRTMAILITNTNVKHELTGSEYPTRRRQCEAAAKALGVPSLRDASGELLERCRAGMDEVVFRRARHVIGEIARTPLAAAAIRQGDWAQAGKAMYASHASLKDDYEVSCSELDTVVGIAESIGPSGGVFGCRMTGGGFGGCAVALVKTDAVDAVMATLGREYKAATGISPTMFVSRPAQGASVLKAG
jgi:galactokinase